MGVDALKMFASLAAAVVGPAVGWLSSRNDQGLLNVIKVLDAIRLRQKPWRTSSLDDFLN